MRTSLLASTALTASTAFMAGAVWAADLPVKAPIAAPAKARFSWSGCYVGVNAGAASNHIDQTFNAQNVASFGSSDRDTSFTGGGQLGCNWQFDPNWVIGLEGDINYLHGTGNQNFHFRFAGEDTVGSQETTVRWLATLRGRFGYAWDRWFLYGTGGLAFGNIKSSVVATDTIPTQYAGSASSDRAGWAAGLGFEYAFAERLSLKLEYLHYDLGSVSYLVNVVAGGPSDYFANASAKVSGDIVRVGLNYRLTP